VEGEQPKQSVSQSLLVSRSIFTIMRVVPVIFCIVIFILVYLGLCYFELCISTYGCIFVNKLTYLLNTGAGTAIKLALASSQCSPIAVLSTLPRIDKYNN